MTFIIVHDLVDPDDPQGRTYKEVNLAKKHNIPIGTLVEFNDGCRLWVVHHARDCDGTPLYCLCIDKDHTETHDPRFYPYEWVTGYPEHSLTVVEKEKP